MTVLRFINTNMALGVFRLLTFSKSLFVEFIINVSTAFVLACINYRENEEKMIAIASELPGLEKT